MPRIPQHFCERAIGMLNAGMTINAVAINIGCSALTILQHRHRFQATGRTEDRSRSERPRVTTHDRERYIRNTPGCAIASKTATATAANTHGTHNYPNCAQVHVVTA